VKYTIPLKYRENMVQSLKREKVGCDIGVMESSRYYALQDVIWNVNNLICKLIKCNVCMCEAAKEFNVSSFLARNFIV